MMKKQDKIRESEREADWRALAEASTEKVALAMRDLYSIYTAGAVEWIGGLYDAQSGGFYYSESARDNEPYFADAESTKQALSFFTSSGLARSCGGYKNMFSERVRAKFVYFAKSMQDENGYFYHAGWGKELTDKKISRRSRDLGWCTSLLHDFGAKPTYPTPNGYDGDYIDANGRPVSRKRGKTDGDGVADAPVVYAENLKDAAAFRAYLDSKDIHERSYHSCSEIITQASQIVERDRQLAECGEGAQLMPMLIGWLNENQHPESGHWHPVSNYYAINGLYKAARIYNAAGLAMPNAAAAVRSAMAAITSDEPMGAVVDIFNSWSAISYILSNQRTHGGEAGEALVREVTAEMRDRATETLACTRQKLSEFRKPDGSFSYTKCASAKISAGMPVAVPDTNEGDVNATTIAISGVARAVYEALGLADRFVPIYTDVDRHLLLAVMGEE